MAKVELDVQELQFIVSALKSVTIKGEDGAYVGTVIKKIDDIFTKEVKKLEK